MLHFTFHNGIALEVHVNVICDIRMCVRGLHLCLHLRVTRTREDAKYVYTIFFVRDPFFQCPCKCWWGSLSDTPHYSWELLKGSPHAPNTTNSIHGCPVFMYLQLAAAAAAQQYIIPWRARSGYATLAEWSKASRLGRDIFGCVGSNPTGCMIFYSYCIYCIYMCLLCLL